jgi:hypothetical protein
MLLLAAYAFAIVGSSHAARNVPLFRMVWAAVGFTFLWISIDETAQIHENSGVLFTKFVGRIPGLTEAYGHGNFAWVLVWLPGIVLFVIAMLVIARVWLSFHQPSRRLALAGVACWVGVIVAETVQARMMRDGSSPSLQVVIEEGLELGGTTLFLVSFHLYLTARPSGHTRRRGLVVQLRT